MNGRFLETRFLGGISFEFEQALGGEKKWLALIFSSFIDTCFC